MQSPMVRAVATLIEAMSPGERETVAAHLATFNVAPLSRGGDLLRYVGGMFEPGAVLIVEDIVDAVSRHDPRANRKQVYNALSYLTRRRAIRRMAHGRYALPAGQVADAHQRPTRAHGTDGVAS